MKDGFLYETHLHTRDASACGASSAEEHVRAHHDAGYTGLVLTDHFFNGNTAIDRELPWPERIEAFCGAYDRALEAAADLDFDVFFGLEYNCQGAEFLTYGIDKTFLLDNPDLLSWPLSEYCNRVRKAGGMIIHAHPFRLRSYISEVRLYTDCIDAVEVVNLGNGDPSFDAQAHAYAREHNFPMTRGSDIHNAKNIRNGGMSFATRPRDIFEMIEMIKATRYRTTSEY